jgi:hypothetical protein
MYPSERCELSRKIGYAGPALPDKLRSAGHARARLASLFERSYLILSTKACVRFRLPKMKRF